MAVPKIIPYDVELRSVNPVRSFDRPKAYTNDLNSVRFQFKVLDMTSEELATATAVTLVYMRDGSFFANPSTDVSRVGNVFSYSLKENEGNHAGVAQIQLVVTVDGMELASQLFDFEIINGLETKVAQEVMIYDWTTLTRDARAYIDQFVADEVFRDAQFDNAQFDRNLAFVSSQESRDLAFGVEQTDRGAAFTTEQTNRNTAFTNDQDARALTFSESESGRTTAETGRVTAEDGRVEAETDRVTEEGKRVTAESGRVTEEGKRVTAESGRVTAESARATAETNRAAAFNTFNTRLTAEETATANNKTSTVKSKTFADVDARFEDIETDTTVMGMNLVTNGDFSNGTTDWSLAGTATVTNKELIFTNLASSSTEVTRNVATTIGNRYYVGVRMQSNSNQDGMWFVNAAAPVSSDKKTHSGGNLYETLSAIVLATASSYSFRILDTIRSGDITANPVKLQYAIAIDLTATFGKGNEPTAEQMDAILAKFPNSWFNGTASLFQSKQALTKQIAIDARTEFDAKNGITNGDFSNGTTGWNGLYGANSVSENVLTNTGDGTNAVARAFQNTSLSMVSGNKLYVKARLRVRNSNCVNINMELKTFNAGTFLVSAFGVTPPIIDTWYSPSAIVTSPSNNPIIAIQVYHAYADAATALGKTMEVQYVTLIDLTATFGAGREPTLAEMDRLMARYPNSWFDSVKPIQTIETLYQEKANKVQESWITPTFLNGWVNFGSNNALAGYFKDNFGIVHLRGVISSGAIGSDAFTLPVGYRPAFNERYAVPSNSLFGQIIVTLSGTVIPSTGSNVNIALNGITFRAEG